MCVNPAAVLSLLLAWPCAFPALVCLLTVCGCVLLLLLLLLSLLLLACPPAAVPCRALWGPGSDPFRSVPTQVGTNYMEWPGLKEVDQEDGQAGGCECVDTVIATTVKRGVRSKQKYSSRPLGVRLGVSAVLHCLSHRQARGIVGGCA
jgi:hypothetical protein